MTIILWCTSTRVISIFKISQMRLSHPHPKNGCNINVRSFENHPRNLRNDFWSIDIWQIHIPFNLDLILNIS